MYKVRFNKESDDNQIIFQDLSFLKIFKKKKNKKKKKAFIIAQLY